MSDITLQDVVEYLQERMSIHIDVDRDYCNDQTRVEVSIKLDGYTFTSDSIRID